MQLFNPLLGVNAKILQTIENERPGNSDLISITYHDFVCSAGVPNQPALFATVRISYIAKFTLLERDSLELYLNSFQKARYESIGNALDVILDDLVNLVSPDLMIIQATQDIRGTQIPVQPSTYFSEGGYRFIIVNMDSVPRPQFDMIRLAPFNLVNKCPTLHKPNVGKLLITYRPRCIPGPQLIDQDWVEEYLSSFWNTELYYEDCVHDWRKKLLEMYHPDYLEVLGVFNQRGGTGMSVLSNNDIGVAVPYLTSHIQLIHDFK